MDLDDLDPHLLRGTRLEGEPGAVVVTRVYRDGGLRKGDVIFKVDGRPIRSRADLNTFLGARSPGDSLRVSLYRSGDLIELTVHSTALPEDIGETTLQSVVRAEVAASRRGLVITRLDGSGSAAEAGLQVGDVLLSVDGQATASREALVDQIARAKANHRASVYVLVRRGPIRGGVILPI